MDNLITVTLTPEEWHALDTYLLFVHGYGKQEEKLWRKLANVVENGRPVFRRAVDNAKYWRELSATVQRVGKVIRKAWVESDSPIA